jgi:two-component system, OmpR family, sensor kinase
VSRLPIRVRLSVAFALALVIVLAAAAVFVYVRLADDLEDAMDEGLRAQADALVELARRPAPASSGQRVESITASNEEGFAQLLDTDGRVLDGGGAVARPALRADELRRALRRALLVERPVANIEGPAMVLARRVPASAEPRIVVVGQSLDDRDEALSGMLTSFAVGGPIAVVLSSLVAYLLATAGLAPMETMRRRATTVSLDRDERLPLPAAQDEVRRLGETLNGMLDRLRRSFERERRFVADASHELRTPIAVVKTELEGALRSGDYGEDVGEALTAAVEECDRLTQLAEDLLVIARATDGGLPVRPEEVDLRALLAGVRDRFGDRAEQHGRRLRVEAPEGLAVVADPLRLRQAVGNLVDNALRHGSGEVVVAARPSSNGVAIEVGDEGPGFDAAILPRAFDRFARGDEARTRGGAGLGLAIVRAVAEAHGGSAEALPGRGGVVRMTLLGRTGNPGSRPASQPSPARAEPSKVGLR